MGLHQALRAKPRDPFLWHIDLPLQASYYPYGFRLDLATDSNDVLAAAAECWRHCVPAFERRPVKIRVIVRPEGALAPEPSFRCQGHLFSIVSDAGNFAMADLESLFGYIHVSAKTAADHAWLRWFFLEALVHTLLAQQYIVPVHAATVARDGGGALLCGASGAGKSTLSFACGRAGWTFITDDCTWLLPDSEDCLALGQARHARLRSDASRFFPEVGGLPARARPNGKLSLEVPLGEFPHFRTASRCSLRRLVFLDRQCGPAPMAEPLPSHIAVDKLLRDSPSYSDQNDEFRERTLSRLGALPAYRLQYDSLDDALEILSRLME